MRPRLKTVCLLSLIVLACSGPAMACPPECPDCEAPNFQGECVPAGSVWDAYSVISGPVNVYDCQLCGWTGHSAPNVSDVDRVYWEYSQQTDYPTDGLTYAWSQSAGTNPELGTWLGATDEVIAAWLAPPCIGTVNIKVVINDEPYPLPEQCAEGSRDDPNAFTYEEAANVTLPTGCEEAGPHDANVYWDETTNFCSSYTDPPDLWGFYDYYEAVPDTDFQVDFRYHHCYWQCEITDVTAKADLHVTCPWITGFVDVESTADVPCAEAQLAKTDLTDPDLTDDQGAPYTKYWSFWGVVEHETTHAMDWHDCYGEALDNAIAFCEDIPMFIDCSNPSTIPCSVVEAFYWALIEYQFQRAWDYAVADFDDPDTQIQEDEVRAYAAEWAIVQPIADALPVGCTP